MDIEVLRRFLAWCTVFNWAFLLIWWAGYSLAGDWIRRVHGKWFGLSKQTLDIIHYSGMAFLKMIVLVFNLVPYLVLRFFF